MAMRSYSANQKKKSAAKQETGNTRHILFTFQILECHALAPKKCSPLSYPLAVNSSDPQHKLLLKTQVQYSFSRGMVLRLELNQQFECIIPIHASLCTSNERASKLNMLATCMNKYSFLWEIQQPQSNKNDFHLGLQKTTINPDLSWQNATQI